MDLPDQVVVATLDTLGFAPDNKDSLNSFIDIKVHEVGKTSFISKVRSLCGRALRVAWNNFKRVRSKDTACQNTLQG